MCLLWSYPPEKEYIQSTFNFNMNVFTKHAIMLQHNKFWFDLNKCCNINANVCFPIPLCRLKHWDTHRCCGSDIYNWKMSGFDSEISSDGVSSCYRCWLCPRPTC